MGMFQDFRNGIRWTKSGTHPVQAFQIAKVIADIRNIFQSEIPAPCQFQKKRELIPHPGMVFIDIQFFHSRFDGRTFLGADDANPDSALP
jgi:hypothetical protein